jgi:hypothetical protein
MMAPRRPRADGGRATSEKRCGPDCECQNGEYELGAPIEVKRGERYRPTKVLSVRVSPFLLESVGELAQHDHADVSELVRRAIREYVSRRTCNLLPAAAPETSNESRPVFTLMRYSR